MTQPPGAATPVHIHAREDEAFYLLDGTMTYSADGELHRLARGSFIFLRRGLPHAFRVTGDIPVRFLADGRRLHDREQYWALSVPNCS